MMERRRCGSHNGRQVFARGVSTASLLRIGIDVDCFHDLGTSHNLRQALKSHTKKASNLPPIFANHSVMSLGRHSTECRPGKMIIALQLHSSSKNQLVG
ncbi:hypothetical protein TNCT_734061 [Trichonephila clavata]|uniref:Uncharacterized protein n=1 Tax=Trichonephila clavata TaxID=2740835 RepID=A0A8X6HZZ1_TRICU|nr:hypothetical protein TNCT_734061 [Trichonephila clavata]